MTDWPLPPFVEPRGARGDDAAVVRAWLNDEIPPHSERLHVEGLVLVVDRDVTLGLRMSLRSVLLRLDAPPGTGPVRQEVERVLTAEGLALQDSDNTLALAVAIQMVGLRMSTWDLWGTDIDSAFASLREAAVGEQGDPPPPVAF